ncbi:MAG: DEAD/DEAH box helicase, partial [Verrucomicrobiae bacterium]|nr:DEAD/DEAH box helicase [Verrucomicrobiae bacterium]
MPASADFAPVSPSAPLPAFAERFGRVDKKVRAALENLGLRAVGDLLAHYPRRHEDRTRFDRFPNQPTGQPLCLRGEITDVQTRFMPGRRRFCEAVVEDPGGGALSGRIVLRWFNMPFIHKLLAVGQEIVLYGEPKQKGKRLVIDHPDYEIVERAGELAGIHLDRIVPVYPATAGLNQRTLRALVFRALEAITDDDLPDRLPAGAGQSEGGADLSRARAVRAIHFPEDFDTLAQARRYLALEEFARLQLELLERRRALDAAGGESRCGSGEILARFLESLPFEPTGAQRHCIDEIRRDLAAPRPMSRLLQGDVGSGKTLVAAAAMVLAAEAGFDAALMAPTQILAEQHFRNFRGWLEPLGVPVRLRTGAKQTDGGDLPLFDRALSGEKPTG